MPRICRMDFADVDKLIGTAMLRDQWRFRRRLNELPGRTGGVGELRQQIELSVAERKRRDEHRPRPQFPPELPVSEKRAEIADAIARHQVVVICGETGSGKTTQLPK